jgi:PAS domain S-box-containing protein
LNKDIDSEIVEADARSIVQHSPNGILLVDMETRIRFVNPAFRRMFHCADGKLIEERAAIFLHSDCFERAIGAAGQLTVKETIPDHKVSFRASLFPIEGKNLYCGIFIDISEEEEAQKHYRALKAQTLQRAQEVISRQMQTAQEIARLLGETTAETKVLLVKLMSLVKEEKQNEAVLRVGNKTGAEAQ